MMNNMVKKDLTQDIGSRMSGNFVCIRDTLTIREAMSELVRQAGVHDNIATLYVVDAAGGVYAGAIDLKDLIIARENDRLADIIRRGYPYVFANERTADCAERIAGYEEDSLPVLTEDRHIAGVLTVQELVELVGDAMGGDYAKLGGLTSEEDLREPVLVSMKKRLPWLIALLFSGYGRIVRGGCFRVGGGSAACRHLLPVAGAGHGGQRGHPVAGRHHPRADGREADVAGRTGPAGQGDAGGPAERWVPGRNGSGVPGRLRPRVQRATRGCPHSSSPAAWGCRWWWPWSSPAWWGTLIPMLFHRIRIDPAVASGPLITTVNDLVAVVTYYGLALVFLVNMFHI